MTCVDVEKILPEVAGGEISGAQAEAAEAHLQGCAACAQLYAQLEATVSLARKAQAAEVPEGFEAELHERLMQAGAPEVTWLQRLRRAIAERPLTTTFAAAGLAAALAVALTHRAPLTTGPATAPVQIAAAPVETAPIARVPSAKVALVKIDFVAERSVDDVQFEIMLPDGLRFFSRGHELAERTFRWKGKLDSGSNPLPIAVKGAHPGRYRVVAHAVGEDLDVTHEVILEVVS
jgi:anti-sigma factor RsiW